MPSLGAPQAAETETEATTADDSATNVDVDSVIKPVAPQLSFSNGIPFVVVPQFSMDEESLKALANYPAQLWNFSGIPTVVSPPTSGANPPAPANTTTPLSIPVVLQPSNNSQNAVPSLLLHPSLFANQPSANPQQVLLQTAPSSSAAAALRPPTTKRSTSQTSTEDDTNPKKRKTAPKKTAVKSSIIPEKVVPPEQVPVIASEGGLQMLLAAAGDLEGESLRCQSFTAIK